MIEETEPGTTNSFLCATVGFLCVAFAISMFYRYPKPEAIGILNENLFIVSAIFVLYLMTKGTFSHKALHHRITLFDLFLEKITLPLATITIFSRYTVFEPRQALTDPVIWVFAILLSDPWQIMGRYLQHTPTIQNGRYLHPLLSDTVRSGIDYLQPLILLVALYIVLWW